jgi:hypothetical protein
MTTDAQNEVIRVHSEMTDTHPIYADMTLGVIQSVEKMASGYNVLCEKEGKRKTYIIPFNRVFGDLCPKLSLTCCNITGCPGNQHCRLERFATENKTCAICLVNGRGVKCDSGVYFAVEQTDKKAQLYQIRRNGGR